MQTLIAELRRRNVFRVAAVYGVVGWVIAQVAVVLETALNLPGWFDGIIVTTLLLGFPVALLLAWIFELTDDGFKQTDEVDSTPRERRVAKMRLNSILAGALVLALGFIIVDRALLRKPGPTEAMATVSREASIAVLPFAVMSAEGDENFFGDGIAEELLNLLSRVDGLRVASRTSAFAFRERSASVGEIAEALDVAHILEGSVRRAGERVRITAQLIDTATDEQLWSDSFERALTAENLFDIQDEIAGAIMSQLQGQMTLATRGELPTQSTEAYNLFLLGRAKIETRRSDDVREGLSYLQQAVALDPDFAEAHIFLARAYALARFYADMKGERERADAIRLAGQHLDIAEGLDPGHPRLALERAWSVYNRAEIAPETQVAAFEAAVAANPGSADAYRGLANVLVSVGRQDEGIRAIEQALALDPGSVIVLINAGQAMERAGRLEEARRHYTRVLKLDPDNPLAHRALTEFAYDSGDIPLAHRIIKSTGDEPGLRRLQSRLYAHLALYDVLAQTEPDLANAYRALDAGDDDALSEAYKRAEDMRYLSGLDVIDIAGLDDLMRDTFAKDQGLYDILTGPLPIETDFYASAATAMEWAYKDSEPDISAIAAGKADAFWSQRSPADIKTPEYVVAMANWRAMRGDAEGAVEALDVLAERGVPLRAWLKHHTFADYVGNPQFVALAERDADTVAQHRAEIEAQLANPPEVWWSPDG